MIIKIKKKIKKEKQKGIKGHVPYKRNIKGTKGNIGGEHKYIFAYK